MARGRRARWSMPAAAAVLVADAAVEGAARPAAVAGLAGAGRTGSGARWRRRLREGLPTWRERLFVSTNDLYSSFAWAPGNAQCWQSVELTFARCCNASLVGGLESCWDHPGLSFRGCCSAAALPRSQLPRRRRVVAALSSTPYRINEINHVLRSLANQTYELEAIYLSYPLMFARDWSWYDVPWIHAGIPSLRINRCEQDFRPETGLLCMLQYEPDPSTYILVVDDDMTYHPTLVDQLLRWSLRQPGAMIGAMGYAPSAGSACRRHDADGVCIEPNLVHSTFGILFQRRFFDAGIFNYDAVAKAYKAARPDRDVDFDFVTTCCMVQGNLWYESHLARKRIPRVILKDTMGSRMVGDLAYGHGALFTFNANDFWFHHNSQDPYSIAHAEEVCLKGLSRLWGPTLWASGPRRVGVVQLPREEPPIAPQGTAAGVLANVLGGLSWLDFDGAVLFVCSGRTLAQWREELGAHASLLLQVAFVHVHECGAFSGAPAAPKAFRPTPLSSAFRPPKFILPRAVPGFEQAGLRRPIADLVELCPTRASEGPTDPGPVVPPPPCAAKAVASFEQGCKSGMAEIVELDAGDLAAVKCCQSWPTGEFAVCSAGYFPRNASWSAMGYANCLPMTATYRDAHRACEAIRARLCSSEEILMCCSAGCSSQRAWTVSPQAEGCMQGAAQRTWMGVGAPPPPAPLAGPCEAARPATPSGLRALAERFLAEYEEAPSTVVRWVDA